MHAEITGFSEEDRVDFMSRMLGGKAEAIELSNHLSRQNLGDLAKVPLLLLFFCTLWKQGKSKSFPESKSKLYLAIIQYVLDYKQGKDSPARFGKVHDFKEVLAEIGKVALECLLKDDHVFEYDQLSAAVLCDESVLIGLLQVSEYAENLRPTGMVSFIHKSIQEFLAAWFVTYRCVPEGSLGGIEQHARSMEDCVAWESVFQFVCGLSDDGAVKVFQHLTSVRMCDPTLDFSKTIPDEEKETEVPLFDVTYRHERFTDLVNDCFQEVQSKASLARHCLDCTAGIILISWDRPRLKHIPKMRLLSEVASCKDLYFYSPNSFLRFLQTANSWIYEVLEFFDLLHVPLRITRNSAALLLGDFLTQFRAVKCTACHFNCILRFYNEKAQFYMTKLELRCDDHVRLFTEPIVISTPSRSTNLCSKQSCLKFLKFLGCSFIDNAQTFKDLGAVIRNFKHLKTIRFMECGDGIYELLDQITNRSTCSLMIGFDDLFGLYYGVSLTSAGAEKLAGVLPRFNVTTFNVKFLECCAAAVNQLVSSITHKTLQTLSLRGIHLTPAVAVVLGQSLPELSSLHTLELYGENESILQVEEMEALFGGINKALPNLVRLTVTGFSARGSLAPLTKRCYFFPNLQWLALWDLNMDESNFRGLLESLTYTSNLRLLNLRGNPLGSQDMVLSIVKQALPQVDYIYY